jgi:acetyl-CoA carboxylase carboxyltransferase component
VDVFDVARGYTARVVDEIIDPRYTRIKIIEALQMTKKKSEKLPSRAKMHGTPPT